MIGRRIVSSWRARKDAIAARLPAPMAAPETPGLRHMRMVLIAQLCLLAVLTAAWSPIATTCLRTPAALAWLGLAVSSLILGIRWLVAKVRADNASSSRALTSWEREE